METQRLPIGQTQRFEQGNSAVYLTPVDPCGIVEKEMGVAPDRGQRRLNSRLPESNGSHQPKAHDYYLDMISILFF